MTTKVFNPLLNETFLIRPHNKIYGSTVRPSDYDHSKQGLLRYAGGLWIPDDGEPDLAFVQGVLYYGVDMPDWGNIIWHWNDADLTKSFLPKYLHKFAKSWHTYTVDNTPQDDEYKWDNRNHPNEIAKRVACDLVCSVHHCANGVCAGITSEDNYPNSVQWIKDKMILIESTMQPLTAPENPVCYLCLDNGKGHLIEALQRYKDDLEYTIEDCEKNISKAQTQIYDYEAELEDANKELPDIIKELQTLGVEVSSDYKD